MEKTPQMRAEEAQVAFFALLQREKAPTVDEVLAGVKAVFTTADLAAHRPSGVVKVSALFSSRHADFCQRVAALVAKELHLNRQYSHLPWAESAYDLVVEAGEQRKFELLSAEECVRASTA